MELQLCVILFCMFVFWRLNRPEEFPSLDPEVCNSYISL